MPDLRDRILQERGLVKVRKPKQKGHTRDGFGKFVPKPKTVIQGKSKTPLMRYLEQKYHVALEDVLISGSLSQVAKQLGNEVDVTTLSKWIKRFRLRYTKDNLPSCEDCRYWQLACEGGICRILMDMEEWDLMLEKRKQIMEGGK